MNGGSNPPLSNSYGLRCQSKNGRLSLYHFLRCKSKVTSYGNSGLENQMIIDHEFRKDDFVCPHCGYKFSDCWKLDENGEDNCSECDGKFAYTKDYVTYYSTEKI